MTDPTTDSTRLSYRDKWLIGGLALISVIAVALFVSSAVPRSSPSGTASNPPNMRISVVSNICWTGSLYHSGSAYDVNGCSSNSWSFPGDTYVTGDFHLKNKCTVDYYGNISCESGSLDVTAYRTDGTVCKEASTNVMRGSAHVSCYYTD